jgi:bifunctional non-homologous end joining protein LigD
MTKTITLEAPSASGRKFYTVKIAEVSMGSTGGAPTAHTVDFRYGAVGGSVKSGTKTKTPVDQAAAEAIFQALVTEKMNGPSHYIAVGESSTAFERPALTATNAEPIKCLSPRLLNDIDPARVVALTADNDWWVQIKHDGDRVQYSTLAEFIRAMGGELEVRAVFPEGSVKIGKFGDIAA